VVPVHVGLAGAELFELYAAVDASEDVVYFTETTL